MNRWAVGLMCGAASFGCSGLLGPDAAQIAMLEGALVGADPEMTVALFLQGSAEAGSVRFGCAEGIFGLANTDAAQRSTILAHTLMDPLSMCPSTCFGDIAPIADLDPVERTRRVVETCDAAGPDVVFGGPLAGLRPFMPALEYLVVRALAEIAGGVSPTFSVHHPALAAGLALMGAPESVDQELLVSGNRPVIPGLLPQASSCGPEAMWAHRVVLDPAGKVAGVVGSDACLAGLLRDYEQWPAAEDGSWAVVDLVGKVIQPLPE